MNPKRVAVALVLFLLFAADVFGEDRLFRFPDVSSDMIAFCYAGDLWTVPLEGGLARKITNDEGLELFPKFSPDGKSIAFTGQYDGNTHVYYMPVGGGEPVRLTYHPATPISGERMGPEHIVMDWTSDGRKILFRSRRETNDSWEGKLMLADISGGLPQKLPVPQGGFASYSPDGSKIVYCPLFRDFRTWKRYKGGLAQDVYIYDLNTYDQKRITDWIGTDNMPMWWGDKIYFNSDRTGTLNLYVYDINTEATRQITNYSDYDVRWPSLGPGRLIYEYGGYLYLLDLATEKSAKVTIELGSDRVLVRPEYVNVSDKVQEFELAPDGKRALFCARGEIFTVPAENGNTRNITNSPSANEKNPVWSPDGKLIAYVSDKTGEDQLYIIPQDGKGVEKQLTHDRIGWLSGPLWAPDSKLIAFADANTNLYIIDIATGNITTADSGEKTGIYDYTWSPDSRWLTYTKIPDPTNIRAIFLYSLDENRVYRITDGVTQDYGPVFDADGKYLIFFSDRNWNAALGGYEFNYVYNAMTGIYLMLLARDTPSPFAPQSDEVAIGPAKADTAKKSDMGEKKTPAAEKLKIDFDGLAQRQVQIPIQPGNYQGLGSIKGRIYYFSMPSRGLSGKKGNGETELRYFDLAKKEDKLFITGAEGYAISFDQSKIIFKQGSGYFINDAQAAAGDKSQGQLNLGGMDMYLDRRAEYRQIYDDAWRRMRDFFYDKNMHGVDWPGMYQRYLPLVEHASHRYDLIYIIGELVGELCCSHSYIGGGDYYQPPSDKIALPGATFVPDSTSRLYRIGKIYQGKNWEDNLRSPLTEPGIDAHEGDYVFEIDGQKLAIDVNPYKLLVDKAERLVTLKIGPTPDIKTAHEITIKPVADEGPLWYYDWVEERRRIVDSLSDGRIGYIHIPDMGDFGLNEFSQQFYHLYTKEGLIIDVRYNGGGFVSQLTLDRLRRVVVGMGAGRHDWVGTYPRTAFHGHMACLINEHSCSDGDIFPYYFRQYGLGPLIGKRTWGGVVGIGGFRPLMDGGYMTIPGGGEFNMQGEWVMENEGVAPDIEIEQTPKLVMQGRDPQLEKAVEMVLEKIKTEPMTLPAKPGPPKPREM